MKTSQQSDRRHRELMFRRSNPRPNSCIWPWLLMAGACLYSLVVLLMHVHHGPKTDALRPPPAAANPSVAESVAPDFTPVASETAGASLGLQKGERLIYQLHQGRSLQVQGASFGGIIAKGAANHSVGLDIQQGGELVVNVYDETKEGWVVGFSIDNAVVRMTSGDHGAPPSSSQEELRSEILALVEKTGRISQMTTQTPTSGETLDHWRDILSHWQTVLSADPTVQSWNQSEEDATGTYVAAYTRAASQGPATLRKQKQRYLSLNGGGPSGFETRSSISGSATIELGPYPIHIQGREQLTLLTPEVGGSVVSQVEYAFNLQKTTKVSELEQKAKEMTRLLATGEGSFAWVPKKEPTRALAAVDIDGTSIQEQLTALEQLLAGGLNATPAEVKVLEKIVACIKQDDAAVDKIAERLSQPQSSNTTELASALIGMLGAAGTPKAQKALIGLVNTAEWPLEQRQMAVFSFAQVTEPMPEVDDWLRQLHQSGNELSNNCLLVLAAMGNRIQGQSPERFQSISDYVISAANAPGLDLNEKVVGLDAIGNLGPSGVPEVVRTALASDDPLLREKALLSLNRVSDGTVASILSNALRTDSAASVRVAAAGLLGNTSWNGGFEALSRAALSDSSDNVRVAAARSLGEWLNTSPEASQVLQQVASKDASQDVRDGATQILQNRGGFEANNGSESSQGVSPNSMGGKL